MRVWWRLLTVLLVAAGAAILADRVVVRHALQHGTPEYQVRLAALMTGLFTGAATAAVAAVVLFAARGRRQPSV